MRQRRAMKNMITVVDLGVFCANEDPAPAIYTLELLDLQGQSSIFVPSIFNQVFFKE